MAITAKAIGAVAIVAIVIVAFAIPMVLNNDSQTQTGSSTGGGSTEYNQAVEDYILSIEYDPDNCIVSTDGASYQQQYTWQGDSSATTTTKYEKKTSSNNGSDVLENLGSQTTKVYPGAILKADTDLANGVPNYVGGEDLERGNTTLSITLPDATSKTVNPKNYNDVKLAIGSMIEEWGKGGTTASLNYTETYTTGQTAKQLSIDLGVDLDFLDGIGIDLGWEDNEETNTYVYDYTRTYYTVSASTQVHPSNYFGPNTTVDQVKLAMNDTPTVFVQNATYGMMILFSATTTSDSSDFNLNLELAIDGHSGELPIEDLEELKNSTYTITIIGATQSESMTFDNSGEEDGDFDDFITYLSAYLADTTVGVDEYKNAALLSAETVFLDSGDVACSFISTEYVTSTTVLTQSITFKFCNYGAFNAYAKLTYYVYDSIDENGNYVNKTEKTTEWNNKSYNTQVTASITAKHVGPFTVEMGINGSTCVLNDYDIGTPQEEVYVSMGGTLCNYDYSLRVDGTWIFDT